MTPIKVTVYMGDAPAGAPLINAAKPVPIILDHNWQSFPLGVVSLTTTENGELQGTFYFNDYKPEYDMLYPSLGGTTMGDRFDIRCVGIHANPNQDKRIKTFGEQLKAQANAAALKNPGGNR